jgi:hypothetical protein
LFNAQNTNFAKICFGVYFGTSAPGADDAGAADAGAAAGADALFPAAAGAEADVGPAPSTPAEVCGL